MTAVAGRRTYTEEELQAALRDIQSGKLGTRRAAVIYGIPRSTLRNKVYKLAMERERESHLPPAVALEDDPMEDDKELSGAEEEKEVEKALQGPLLSMADILRFSSATDAPEALKALLLQRAGKEGDLWAGLEHSAVGPYIQSLLVASQQKPEDFMLPELMRKIIAEDQHLNNGDTEKSHLQPSPSNSVKNVKVEMDTDAEESSSNVILKIPSFKPTTSKNGGDSLFNTAIVSPPVTSESSGSPPIMPRNMLSLREAISKSIIEKFQQSPEPSLKMPPAVDMDFKRAGYTPPLGAIPVIKNHQESPQMPQPNRNFTPNMNKTPQNNNNTNNNNSSSSTTGGKGTRPKRGKYRNYDRDSLVEAVRAVQRGEMSVHRAGSYYGVPHSTLEYKVKERHLMRPRKRDPKPNPVDEKIASLKSQDISRNNIPDKMKPVIKPPQKFPPTSPNGIKMPPMFDPAMTPLGYTTPPFPFWPHPSFPHLPLDYPRNPSTSQFSPNPEYYASQMMQRLQEDSGRVHPGASGPNSQPALAKSAREMAESLYDGSGTNGSFLDGIIRSSLESGVPTDKSNNKEDKNVTPENMSNKALLDQLCRNSRITPLSKSSVEPNSSGDEGYKKSSSPVSFATSKNSNDRDSPIALNLGKPDSHEIQTVDLSNDSNESSLNENGRTKEDGEQTKSISPPSRIYVKPQFQEITKPENLKPESLVRFRDSLMEEAQQKMVERNGSISSECAIGSASEDMVQD